MSLIIIFIFGVIELHAVPFTLVIGSAPPPSLYIFILHVYTHLLLYLMCKIRFHFRFYLFKPGQTDHRCQTHL